MNPVMTTHFIATPPSAIVTLITLFALLLCVLVPRSSLETIDSLKLICYTIHIAIRLIGGILMNPVMTTHFIATPPSAIVTLITLFALLLCVLVPRSSLETIDSLKLDTT